MAQQDRALVFSYDYYPGVDFDVVSQLQTSTTVRILRTAEGETVSEISQPDEYTGHIIRYDFGGGAGITSFLFLREQSLSAGSTQTLSQTASMFSPQLNLMQTTLS